MSAAVIGFVALFLCVLAFGFLLGAIWAGIRRDDDPPFDPFDDGRVEKVFRTYEHWGVEGRYIVGVGPTPEIAYRHWLESVEGREARCRAEPDHATDCHAGSDE